ncbi:hypothetical protein Tco_1048015 [Tanacetum coccineum]
MTSKAQQIALDNTLVALENQRVIGKCNMRINPGMKPKESTYQVMLDALALTTCYPSFLITAEVPVIYMHQFLATIVKHKASYRFKIDNKRFSVNVKVFRDILNICPRITEIKYITDVIVDHLHQPWRTFALIINKCLCGNEDLAYQIDNKDSKKQDKMFYHMYTKIIIHHFLKKDKSISMRNRTFMHTAWDDSLLGTMGFVSRHEDTQVYGAILPKSMTNQAMLDSVAYKTYYAIASRAKPPKSKKPKRKSDSAISSEETPSIKKSTKAKKDTDRGKSLNVLSEVALSEAAQLKEITKRSKKDFHISHASGSGDGTDFQSGVPDEQQRKISSTDEGICAKPGVPDVPKYDSEIDKESWNDSGEEDDDKYDTEDDEGNDDGDDSDGNDDDDDDDNDDDGDDDDDDDDDNDGNDDDDNDGDDDDDDNDSNDDDDDSDHERTESDRDENHNLN